jgi:hypothetical protein
MSTIGAAKVMTKTGPVWCHYSKTDDTIKLRRYIEGTTFEIDIEGIEIEEFVPLSVCKTFFESQDGYGYKSNVWTKILRKLEAKVAPSPKHSAGRVKRTPITVPITVLRQFYETMKLLETATWVNLAQFYSNAPDSLERLWNHSRKAFLGYNNHDDFGRGKRKTLPTAPHRVADISTTTAFTAFITKPNNSCIAKTGYVFVARELNPRRTQLGVFSDTLPATKSGAGGIDVLLKSDATGFPVVGEVKVNDDKNAYFALVQAMTYAVELSTPNQLSRLKTHFGDPFGTLNAEHGMVAIALLMVNHVPDDSREPILKLIKALNERKKCEGLGGIVLVENHGEEWICHT